MDWHNHPLLGQAGNRGGRQWGRSATSAPYVRVSKRTKDGFMSTRGLTALNGELFEQPSAVTARRSGPYVFELRHSLHTRHPYERDLNNAETPPDFTDTDGGQAACISIRPSRRGTRSTAPPPMTSPTPIAARSEGSQRPLCFRGPMDFLPVVRAATRPASRSSTASCMTRRLPAVKREPGRLCARPRDRNPGDHIPLCQQVGAAGQAADRQWPAPRIHEISRHGPGRRIYNLADLCSWVRRWRSRYICSGPYATRFPRRLKYANDRG